MAPDSVTPEKCREYQAACRGEILAAVKELGKDLREWAKESREDRAELHAEVAALSEAIAYQKGMANGHPHHRTSDPPVVPSLAHSRAEDSMGGWVKEWKWYVLLVALLAAYAGHEILPLLEKLMGVSK